MRFLSVHNLSKTYEQQAQPALYPIDFALEQGEIMTILGESGSGKSTFLKLLAGLLDVSTGEISLGGKPIKGPSYKLVAGYDAIQLVNQGFLLSPNMRVWENLKFNLLKTPKAYQAQRIEELLVLCKLAGFADRYPRELSGGQQQRVAIGRALANKPKLLLLDEPFSNLDVILKNQLLTDLVEIIRQSETTALFVMHQPADALRISDRIGIIKSGRFLQIAAPSQVYNEPANPYVAQLFDTPTICKGNVLNDFVGMEKWPNHALFCLREQHIQLTQDQENSYEATILKRWFYGSYWKVQLKLDTELACYANIPINNSLQEGTQIRITIDWKQVYQFKE